MLQLGSMQFNPGVRMRHALALRLGAPALFVLATSCHDPALFDEDVRAEFRSRTAGSEGASVDGSVVKAVLMPTQHLQWPADSPTRKIGDLFARVQLDDDHCYLVGPAVSASVVEGARLKGTVKLQLIEQWPIEVLSLSEPCLPLDDATVTDAPEPKWEIIEIEHTDAQH